MSYFTVFLSTQAHTLRLPTNAGDDIARYVLQSQKGGAHAERSPFRRQLDLWGFSIASAVNKELQPMEEPSSKWGTKFVDTRSVEMPEGLCDLLALLALRYLGPNHEGIDDAKQIIELGNQLAGAGCPQVLERLNSKDLRVTALDKALEYAGGMLS